MIVTDRRKLLITGAAALATAPRLIRRARAQTTTLRFGIAPMLPNASDTIKQYTPLFAYIAKELGVDYDLKVSSDFAGMAVAMGSGQLDLAWMGPWGYIIANNATACQAVATANYDGKPIYHAIIVGRPDLDVKEFPQSTKGMSISFADVGSTSGWLIPTFTAKTDWHIDPKTFWQYREGSTHPANEIAVASGQTDLATDYDRNRTAMIEIGALKPDATKIVWTSSPLPNDAIAVPKDTSPELSAHVQSILTGISGDQAKALLAPHYTGFTAATHASYDLIEKAGIAVGKIKPRV